MHILVCGVSTDVATYQLLMGDEPADFVFTDPPCNVRIDGHVSGLGRIDAFVLEHFGRLARGQHDAAVENGHVIYDIRDRGVGIRVKILTYIDLRESVS
jgi:hypothetical protein